MSKVLTHALIATVGLAGVALSAATPALSADFIVAISKPNKLFLIDVAAREVVRDCDIPGRGSPLTVSVNPDGDVAYVVTAGWGEISGINLDTCEEVFRANMSEGNIRGKTIGAMTVTRDGSEIYAMQSRVELLSDRYTILPHRVAVFDATAGLEATPTRTFDVPRGLTIMAPSADGEHIWAGGHDLYKIHMASGTIVETIPILYWQETQPTYGTPDGLAFWPIYETTETMVMPFGAPEFSSREARDAGNFDEMVDFKLGATMIDLTTNEVSQVPIASMDLIIFSLAKSPTDPKHIYGVYSHLSKYDLDTGDLVHRIELDHTYYSAIVSSDGSEIYIGSTFDDIAIHSTETLEQIATIELPGGGDQGAGTFRVVQR